MADLPYLMQLPAAAPQTRTLDPVTIVTRPAPEPLSCATTPVQGVTVANATAATRVGDATQAPAEHDVDAQPESPVCATVEVALRTIERVAVRATGLTDAPSAWQTCEQEPFLADPHYIPTGPGPPSRAPRASRCNLWRT